MKYLKRALFAYIILLASTRLFAVGWTPTDAGLVVNLEQGERFLLSVVVSGDFDNNPATPNEEREFFVSNYTRYTGGYYNYGSGTFMKLLPATEVTEMNEWSVGAPLDRGNKALGGIVYTIWNDGKTLKTKDKFKFLGDLTSSYTDGEACDVVFVIPTERGVPTVDGRPGLSSFDPNNTLGRGNTPFNGRMGTGFLGMTYREVYMLQIPKANSPQSYTNAGLVTFNTTLSTWKLTSGAGDIAKGKAAYAYADSKHDKTPRTIFRLYLLDNPMNSCSGYFFATDEQDYKRYRKNENNPQRSSDSTAAKKIYSMDRLTCMTRKGSTKYYQTDLLRVPEPDSTYYYVGYDNAYKDDKGESMGSNGAHSMFTKIRELPMKDLTGFKAPAGAYGRMVVDTTSAADNLDVRFDPAGYFLKVETGKNVRMHYTGDNKWTSEEMWTITGAYAAMRIKTMLMTGQSFSESDPGAAVEGWTKWVRGDSVPTSDGKSIKDKSGYAQITINNTDSNGHMVFILADKTKWIQYHNNGFMGLEMPRQYPLDGNDKKVTLMDPRIKPEYTFLGWDTQADGNGTRYPVGEKVDLANVVLTGDTVLHLYAQARYDGTLHIAISFLQGDKRYFLTHPGTGTGFRFASARHFDSWINTWQGMENAQNLDPNYLSTYEVRHPINKIKKKDGNIPDLYPEEHVLAPRRYTMKGQTDSLTFYENFKPTDDEYIGLYYTTPNVILANNTWAGLFRTTSPAETSWPTYKTPYIPSAKIYSERYVQEYDPENKPDSLILKVRSNSGAPYVKYDAEHDQFIGVATPEEATDFQMSAVIVADEHYILLPDTAYAWQDTITFDYHQGKQTTEDIWSALVGKQLMAVMFVDGDTVYFHPNRNKHITDPNDLYLSPDFRVTQIFEWIPDSRVTSVADEDRVAYSTTDHYWHHTVTSGLRSPMNVKDKSGNYIDIIDTFSITLSQGAISKIKKYYGRWLKQGEDDGLTVSADGLTRHRNIIVKTKTYHYGEEQTRVVLKPEKESYSFGPLKGQSQQINFILTREHVRNLLDAQGAFVREDTISIDTLTTQLGMQPGKCTFRVGTAFKVDVAVGSHVTLSTNNDNSSGIDYDTLVVTGYEWNSVPQTCDVRVPLIQAALEGDELLWSVMHNGQRYFIMAGTGSPDHFIFRQYNQKGNTIYKRNTTTPLIMGSKDAENSDEGYITPWQFTYVNKENHQLTLKIGLTPKPAEDTLYFKIQSETTPAVDPSASSPSTLTYVFTDVYANTNANYEEQVKLKYGPNKWLKFNGSALTLTDSLEADTFSWAYPLLEFNLLNNGTYPSQTQAAFGYNSSAPASITTAYQGYCEYSTLLDNKLMYFARESRNTRDDLTSRDPTYRWKTICEIDTLRDKRTSTPSGLTFSNSSNSFTSTITPTGLSPLNVQDAGGNYIDIVDTLRVRLGLQTGAPSYRFKGDWSGFKRIEDGNLKIPLVRRTYHDIPFDSLVCEEANPEFNHSFPAVLIKEGENQNDTLLLEFSTIRRRGTRLQNTSGDVVSVISSTSSYVTRDIKYKGSTNDSIKGMHLNDKDLAEVRLMDEYGNTPTWCKIKAKGDSTITLQCLSDGVRSPRSTELYLVYVITIEGEMRIVTYRLTVSQVSHFDYANNQQLIHTSGASGDPIGVDGLQQVHQNKRILYYYPDQDVELPVRERNFYGWWRWYREGKDVKGNDVSDSDIPDSIWRLPPRNIGKYNYPYRIIGDSVKVPNTATSDPYDSVKALMTMGRYTVFHYRSKDYAGSKKDPPAKNPRVAPPITEVGLATKPTLTYAVDISNYYDNLPMSVSQKNQVDTALLDTIDKIKEPTLSLREVFELHPWTEMAENLNHFKSKIVDDGKYELSNEHYLEDHVVMAPTGNKLLLSTEQRYNYTNVHKGGFSESLLGYYMRDDNWWKWSANRSRQDTMIWCGGWDADCLWYIYNPRTKQYTPCDHPITESDDFLQVPVKNNIDTVYYCLRARSWKSTFSSDADDATVTSVEGDSMFNICRYKICYHYPNIYGPKVETRSKKETRALLTNDEIEQRYDVLERLNFDYNEPGSSYTIYPHPLPWADASYGYTYPETPDLPHNRRHEETDFPNHGEYGLINRIGYTTYWLPMEQHGGASKGYMIYCDGMSSSGQVAALSLSTVLCSGQKMFLSAYVGNPSSQTGKSNPNFTFSIQGSMDGETWENITTYMTGDIMPSDKWYQILIPIKHSRSADQEYQNFRIRIYNVASDFDGNDFIIDDLCVFATKPPLIAYQANTACKEEDFEKDTHVILRIDYTGIPTDEYNNHNVFYTVRKIHGDTSFVAMTAPDQYLKQETYDGSDKKIPKIYGKLYIPAKDYIPTDADSIFVNMNDLLDRFDESYKARKVDGKTTIFQEGYVYEILEGVSRPVKYVVHNALMDPEDTITVHISLVNTELLNSVCGMTSRLNVSNRMVLELNGLEKPHTEVTGLCVNSTYDISLRVKGTLYLDSVAPIDLNGSCINDWLLYGDTADASSKKRYGYYYSDIKKVITEILRVEPMYGTNKNQFAPNLSSINKNELNHYTPGKTFKQAGLDPYTLISDMVNNGFLTLYKSKITTTVSTGDSAKYIIFPIVGTGTDALNKANVEVCPLPILVKLKPDESAAGVPLMIGGLHRDSTQMKEPVEVLATELMANEELKIRIDSLMPDIGIKTITLRETNDPEFRKGIHTLALIPDISYPIDAKDYYHKGDSMVLAPADGSYHMRPGYSYTFNIIMQDKFGKDTVAGGCAVGTIPFILSVMPNYLRWEPQSEHSNGWNNADSWIAIDAHNNPIPTETHFAPMVGTYVVIPKMEDGMPYPVVPQLPRVWKDSVQKVNFEYNNCNVVRFLPGAALGNQYHMQYTDAVVDMEMPQQKWAFRSAPVTGMLSGDIYMANADLNNETPLWEVGAFDAAGRSYKTGNGSFWLSVYSRATVHEVMDSTEHRAAEADWSKVTNGVTLSLPAGSGFAVYARTKAGNDAVTRLPKNDDIYYYYNQYGDKLVDHYEQNLRTMRNTNAGGTAGKLAFDEKSKNYTITNGQASSLFVFGNPTMAYIDIWGFIDDNCLTEEFDYMNESGDASLYQTVNRATAEASANELSNRKRYLPPLHSIVVKTSSATSLSVRLDSCRVVTDTTDVIPSVRSCGGSGDQSLAHAPQRNETSYVRKGIMTVTAKNPCSPRCTSYLLLGQGYHDDIRSGEDAILTTVNIHNFSMNSTPTTPFNLYAVEGHNAMSIDLLDELNCVPVSFYMSDLEYDPVTHLWFTGVNNIDGSLVFYDALTQTERPIIDGICITIETPTTNHERRYFICRPGYLPDQTGTTTDLFTNETNTEERAIKFIRDDQVLILREGHVYTMFGQKIQ